jgi:glyoxylase-like metal-dependent hydrolase (beta-lactamase superfamily II)
MKLIQRTENLYELSMGMIKAFLIDDGKDLVLIDTGIKGKAEAILRAIDKASLDSSRLKHILITHLHSDHTGSLHDLKEKTSALVYAHNLEANAIEEGKILRDCVPAPSLMSQISVPLILKRNKDKRIMGTTVDVRLSDGDFLAIGGGIRVVFSPGHTIGHVSFLLQKEQNILITGDAAWGGKNTGISPPV